MTVTYFSECDVESPEAMIEDHKRKGFLFPPIIKRMKLDERHMSPFMQQRYIEENKKPTGETVVQTYHGKQIFIMTPLAQFYLSRGMKIKNITKFIQYEGGAALKPFAEKVVNMRIEATHEKDEAKSNTAKLYGNSGKFSLQSKRTSQ